MAISEEPTFTTMHQVFARLADQLQNLTTPKKKALSEERAFEFIHQVFKRVTKQLLSNPSLKGLEKSGSDEFLPKFEEGISTAMLIDGRIDNHKARVFLGLDNMDEFYLFMTYCKRLFEDVALCDRYLATYFSPFDENRDGLSEMLHNTWIYLFDKLIKEDSEFALELDGKSKEFLLKPEPDNESKTSNNLANEDSELTPASELEDKSKEFPTPEPDKRAEPAAYHNLRTHSPSKEEKAVWYGIVDAMLGLANVFSSLYSMVPIIVKKIEHVTVSMKPEKKSEPRNDAAIVTASQSSTSTTEKTTVDSQNIFGMFGKILYSAFSLTTVPGVLGVQRHDSGNKRPGPSPAA